MVHLTDAATFADWLKPLRQVEWVVYSKRPFAGPEAVLSYLSRYTHRVAISNSRLLRFDDQGATFKCKDYHAKGNARYKTLTLTADEFIRRFLSHVLPTGFHRIRHYGLFANTCRQANLSKARALLDAVPSPEGGDVAGTEDDSASSTAVPEYLPLPGLRCPHGRCGSLCPDTVVPRTTREGLYCMNSEGYYNVPNHPSDCGLAAATPSLALMPNTMPFYAHYPEQQYGQSRLSCDEHVRPFAHIPVSCPSPHPGADQIPIARWISVTLMKVVAVSFLALVRQQPLDVDNSGRAIVIAAVQQI